MRRRADMAVRLSSMAVWAVVIVLMHATLCSAELLYGPDNGGCVTQEQELCDAVDAVHSDGPLLSDNGIIISYYILMRRAVSQQMMLLLNSTVPVRTNATGIEWYAQRIYYFHNESAFSSQHDLTSAYARPRTPFAVNFPLYYERYFYMERRDFEDWAQLPSPASLCAKPMVFIPSSKWHVVGVDANTTSPDFYVSDAFSCLPRNSSVCGWNASAPTVENSMVMYGEFDEQRYLPFACRRMYMLAPGVQPCLSSVVDDQMDLLRLYPCRVIYGNGLKILGPLIKSLWSLERLNRVYGYLVISNTSLVDFRTRAGKPLQLAAVSALDIDGNGRLSSLEGLNWLQLVLGQLRITNNPSLETIRGLSPRVEINGDIVIASNNRMQTLEGLYFPYNVLGSFTIANNTKLESLRGAENVTTINGNLRIYGNNLLNNTSGLSNVEVIGGTLVIESNPSLVNLDTFQMLNMIGFTVNPVDGSPMPDASSVIRDNAALAQILFAALFYCTSLEISLNPMLDLIAFASLDQISGDLRVSNNLNLRTLGFIFLQRIFGSLAIIHNPSIVRIIGLSNLTFVNDDLKIENNKNLKIPGDFNSLFVIGGNLHINGNAAITVLSLFSSLQIVGGDVVISANPRLLEILAFDTLLLVNGSLVVNHNPLLSDIRGFGQLMLVRMGIQVKNNSNIAHLGRGRGIGELLFLGGPLVITDNDSLENVTFFGSSRCENFFLRYNSFANSFGKAWELLTSLDVPQYDVNNGWYYRRRRGSFPASGGVFSMDDSGGARDRFAHVSGLGSRVERTYASLHMLIKQVRSSAVGAEHRRSRSVQPHVMPGDTYGCHCGPIQVSDNKALRSFNLPFLTVVEGDFELLRNPSLVAASMRIHGRGFVLGTCRVEDNMSLDNLFLIETNVTSYGFVIKRNAKLKGVILGAESIAPNGTVWVEDNDAVVSIDIGGVRELDSLVIIGQPLLASIGNLSSLTTVSGDLLLSNLTNLASVELASLVTVGGTFNVSFCPLVTVISPPNLASIGGSVVVQEMARLQSMAAPFLVQVGGSVVFTYNALTSIISAPVLTTVGGNITFDGTRGPISFTLNLPMITTIGGDVTIVNSNPTHVPFPDIQTIGGSYTLVNNTFNPRLWGSLPIYSSLTSIGGQIRIENNANVGSFVLAPNIIEVRRGLTISNNPDVVTIAGFNGLLQITGNFEIDSNPSLTGIYGFDALSSVQGKTSIKGNPLLCHIPNHNYAEISSLGPTTVTLGASCGSSKTPCILLSVLVPNGVGIVILFLALLKRKQLQKKAAKQEELVKQVTAPVTTEDDIPEIPRAPTRKSLFGPESGLAELHSSDAAATTAAVDMKTRKSVGHALHPRTILDATFALYHRSWGRSASGSGSSKEKHVSAPIAGPTDASSESKYAIAVSTNANHEDRSEAPAVKGAKCGPMNEETPRGIELRPIASESAATPTPRPPTAEPAVPLFGQVSSGVVRAPAIHIQAAPDAPASPRDLSESRNGGAPHHRPDAADATMCGPLASSRSGSDADKKSSLTVPRRPSFDIAMKSGISSMRASAAAGAAEGEVERAPAIRKSLWSIVSSQKSRLSFQLVDVGTAVSSENGTSIVYMSPPWKSAMVAQLKELKATQLDPYVKLPEKNAPPKPKKAPQPNLHLNSILSDLIRGQSVTDRRLTMFICFVFLFLWVIMALALINCLKLR
eukprot:Opistho-2@4618